MTEESSLHQGIVKLLYLEIVRKDEYMKWRKDPSYVGEAALAKERQQLDDGDLPPEFQQRFEISHLNRTLAAWQAGLSKLSSPLYSFADVSLMESKSHSVVFEYMLDELTWECEYSVKMRYSVNGNKRKTLVIHLPNDEYFYINGVPMEEFLKVKRVDTPNNRHKKCHDGWSLLDKDVWNKIHPFETYMVSWFGENYTPTRMEKTILYHGEQNRVDICMRHRDRHVGIEFSFEHSYPVVLDDDWWHKF